MYERWNDSHLVVKRGRKKDDFLSIGEAVTRKEDLRLVTGGGGFLDDIKPKGALHVSYVRSPYPHARIKSITSPKDNPETLVFTSKELDYVLPMQSTWPGASEYSFPLLAKGEVLYAGQLVCAVVSTSRSLAEDVAELVEVDYEPLPFVVETEDALKAGAPILHEDSSSNLLGSWTNQNGDFDAALREADVVVSEKFSAQRVTGQAIEPRGAIASYDQTERKLSVWLTSQCPHFDRTLLAECLGIPEEGIVVHARDVGGGFGINSHLYPEQILLCALASKLGRPVKWTEDRREHVAGAIHSGDCTQELTLAATREGRILGLRDRIIQNAGAYLQTRHIVSTFVTAMLVPGPYRIPSYSIELKAVYSNKGPVGTYRAFGMTQATFARERLIDILSRELDIDPVEVRKRNLIASEEFPYVNPAGLPYDSGDYARTLSKALELADYNGFKKRDSTGENLKGRPIGRGIGIGFYIEVGGVGALHALPTRGRRYSPYESARARLESDGKITIFTGAAPTGQGLETTLAQIAAEELGVPLKDVTVVHGDTDLCPYSNDGTIASRSANMAGNAVFLAATRLKESIGKRAKEVLGSEIDDGRDVVPLSELARKISMAEGRGYAIEETSHYQPKSLSGTTAYGVQIAEVEVELETARVEIKKLTTVHDCGRMLNPSIVEGMTDGGCAQGISAALLEEVYYKDDGSILSTTFGDYLIPTAVDMPQLVGGYTVTLSPTNPLGVKGGGEGGIIGAPAAIANAIYDALRPESVSLPTLLTRQDELYEKIKSDHRKKEP